MVVKQYLLIKSTVSMAPAVTFIIVHCRTTHKHYSSLCMVLHYGVLLWRLYVFRSLRCLNNFGIQSVYLYSTTLFIWCALLLKCLFHITCLTCCVMLCNLQETYHL